MKATSEKIETGAIYACSAYKVKISRVTENSIFCFKMTQNYDGTEAGYTSQEFRFSHKTFLNFIKQQ